MTRSRSASRAGRTSVAPEWPSSWKIHSAGTSSRACAACSRSAAVCEPIVSSFFCRALETRAYIAALVMGRPSLLARPHHAGLPLRYQYGVGHRQIGGGVAAEDKLRPDHPVVHLRGWFLRPRAKNSASACATTAEIVRPDRRGCSRTAAASRAGTLTVNTTVASEPGPGPMPPPGPHTGGPAAASTRTGLPHPRRPGRRDARLRQLRGRVDPLSMLAAISAATDHHAISVLLDMSLVAGETPGACQPPVAERDIKAEVIYCVGGIGFTAAR